MNMNTNKILVVGMLFVWTLMVPVNTYAGNKKLMTVSAAKKVAQRAIVETVNGLKVRSQETVTEMLAENMKIDVKTSAAVVGIEYTDIVYDPDKDIAAVTAELRLGSVTNIVGKRINFGDQVISRVGFATSTPASAKPLQAMRAAELAAYRELAERVVGLKLQSETTVENYILKSDTIRTKLMAAIYGAEVINHYWDEDGNAHVKMRLKVGDVDDVLGQRVRYKNEVIEVEGVGAQEDDFSAIDMNSGGSMTRGATKIREGSLSIPIGAPSSVAPAADVGTGGAASLQ